MKNKVLLFIVSLAALSMHAQQRSNGHEYVDLGLSVKWAACNVGATKSTDVGNFYQWGCITPCSHPSSSNCVTWQKDVGHISGNAKYDVAKAKWGGNWRMPTKDEFEELKLYCTAKMTTRNGVKGILYTSKKNGKSIFLPMAGSKFITLLGKSEYETGEGRYWTGTKYSNRDQFAYQAQFNDTWGNIQTSYSLRDNAHTVRPVLDTSGRPLAEVNMNLSNEVVAMQKVDLGLSVYWSGYNIGSLSPFKEGNYFSWGCTGTKEYYTAENALIRKMGDISGNSDYDAATAQWEKGWRLPTKEEMDELVNRCTWTWGMADGRQGYKVTGPNGRSIFFVAAGKMQNKTLSGGAGYYLTSTPGTDASNRNAYILHFGKGANGKPFRKVDPNGSRIPGISVRPVLSK